VAAFNILIKDKAGKVCCEKLTTFNKFQNGGTWGWSDFVSRSSIIGPSNDVLNHRALTIELRIKPDNDNFCKSFLAKNTFVQNMLDLFLDEETSDVSFEVNNQPDSGKQGDILHS